MVLFSPWAFGTTQPWSIWAMNGAGYFLGLLLGVKLIIRFLTGYRNPCWDRNRDEEPTGGSGERERATTGHFLSRVLAALTVLLIGYCFVSALNSRSIYNPAVASLEYHSFVSWLPHSYDSASSWQAFCNYLAIALSFWAARDWLLGKTPDEERAERGQFGDPHRRRESLLPERLRRLLWVLTINGGLLGLEGIVQRIDGTPLLLFIQSTHDNPEALAQFGPYAYRSNAAQYFNLLWPVSLGLWWTLERSARRKVSRRDAFGIGSRHLVLVCAMIMAACPIISASRMGAAVAVVNLALAAAVLWSAQPKEDVKTKVAIAAGLAVVLGFSALVGWEGLGPRLAGRELEAGLEGRNQMYDMARPMADDCALYGTGPGTFGPLFQLYRPDPAEYWPAQLHNDWLETLITFGWLGSALIILALCIVLFHWFVARGIHAKASLALLFWAALGGCLFYARYDFPFQIYSVIFLFFVLCAALFTLSHERAS
ncbi:MAG: O-antigen ligase family protein [Verrucomicrobiota bacterium]|jgi:O-antigen ligase